METDGLVVAANKTGNLKVADAETGRLALTASTPVMWDSDTTAGTTSVAAPSVETVSDSDKARMPVTVGDDTMSITPDQKMLDAPDTKFPVYVDPSFTTYRTGFAMVTASNPTSTYFNTADDALVGSNNGVNKWRTFFNFFTATAPFVGKHVQSADLRLQEKWSGSCTPTPFDAYATYAAGSTTTWNNQPTWSTKQDTQTVAKGYSPSGMGGASACPAGEVRMSITPITQQAANNGGNITIGLRSPDETKLTYWKRFDNNPKISVIYNSIPTVSGLTIESEPVCVSGSTRPSIDTTQPTLAASASDSDGGNVQAEFEWAALDGTKIGSQLASGVPSGSVIQATVPSGALNLYQSYKWRVRAFDGFDYSPFSGYCEFCVDDAGDTDDISNAIVQKQIAGASEAEIDAYLQSQFGLTNVSQATDDASIQSTRTDIRVPRPSIYKNNRGHYIVSASWQWKDLGAVDDDASAWCGNCNVGGDDGFGVALSRNVKSVQKYTVATWGTGINYYKISTTRMQPSDANVYGASFMGQDRIHREGACCPQDYNFYNGNLVYEIKSVGCGTLQAFSKYAHTWKSTTVNSIGVGPYSLSVGWSSSDNKWELASQGSNAVKPC